MSLESWKDRERDKGKSLFKENRQKTLQIWEKKRTYIFKKLQEHPAGINQKRITLRHIITQVSKLKRENLESSMRKVISNIQESFHKITDGFLSRNLQDRREWDDILKAQKEKTTNQEYCI